jgi:hypothetical protein
VTNDSCTTAGDFNGIRVSLPVFGAAEYGGNFSFIAGSDSIDSHSVDKMTNVIGPKVFQVPLSWSEPAATGDEKNTREFDGWAKVAG